MNRWAVFDVDGTLLPNQSMEQMFIKYGVSSGLIPIKNLIFAAGRAAVSLIAAKPGAAFKKNKLYLKGLPAEKVKSAARDFCEKFVFPRLALKGKQQISTHRKNGFKIMILTGAPESLAHHLKEVYQPDHMVCSVLETSGSQYTGEIEGVHPYSQQKREMLLDLHPALKINFRTSVVFANHHSDVAHMELFGKATAVNPTWRLRRVATQRNWPVEIWR